MITNILVTKGYERGYLPKGKSTMLQPVFATANLAVRKDALNEIGHFDENCRTGEDMELSIKLSRTNWELFFESKAVISHKHRTTLSALLRQWYRYGKYHPYIFKKYDSKCINIYYRRPKGINWPSVQFSKIFGIKIPFHALIFITPFHIFNAFLALTLLSLIIKSRWMLTVSLTGLILEWAYFSARPFFSNISLKKIGLRITHSVLRYILNWAYVTGAFLGGLRIGVFYIEATREHNPPLE